MKTPLPFGHSSEAAIDVEGLTVRIYRTASYSPHIYIFLAT
jgi:hypothetical protein